MVGRAAGHWAERERPVSRKSRRKRIRRAIQPSGGSGNGFAWGRPLAGGVQHVVVADLGLMALSGGCISVPGAAVTSAA